MAVKTLLVGLGGTGCTIVANVKRMVGTSDPDIQFIGFDTDGNPKGKEGLTIISTSRDMTVRQYLKSVDNWEEWFPDEANIMIRKMTAGAGQIRPLSRLAFAETVSSGRIRELEEAIRKLRVSRGDAAASNFRIMIVSSFAGGTGSGMFIQMALFLREYINEHYGCTVLIRGLFAMPDIFMGKQFNNVQRESMYANAYAALKELNAINRVCLSGNLPDGEINMTIDSLFDSKRDKGNAGKKPFDFIFFVDNINEHGKVLSTYEDYMELMTTATYMQVYSPVTEEGDSKEDNLILSVIAHGGAPLYGSVGASKIVYPYRELVEYCGKRATIDAISDKWTLIDRKYRKDNERRKKEMLTDPQLSPLDRGEHYIGEIESQLEEGNQKWGFVRAAVKSVSDDRREVDRVEMYYESVYNYVLDRVKSYPDIQLFSNAVGVTEKQLKGNNLVAAVTRSETALKDYFDAINSGVAAIRNRVVRAIIPDDLSDDTNNLDSDHSITKLLMLGGHAVHPIAMRVLLYKLREKVKQEQQECHGMVANRYKAINDYFKKAYDVKSTEEVETAVDRASEGGLIKRSKFRTEYLKKVGEQVSRLNSYRDAKIVDAVFSALLQRLDAIIGEFERLFDSLDTIKDTLVQETTTYEENAHTNTAEADIYLCSTPEEKRELYDSLGFDCSDSSDGGVYDLIFYSLYASAHTVLELAAKKANVRLSTKDLVGIQSEKMASIFRETILKRNIDDVATRCNDKLDIDISQALVQYCRDDGAASETEAAIKAVIGSAHEKSLPYLKHNVKVQIQASQSNVDDSDASCAYNMTFWGINPEVKESLSNLVGSSLNDLFTAGDIAGDPSVLSSNEYSKYEISCYQALYCVALSDIPKFLETGDDFGVFYKNYANRIQKMAKRETDAMTPHLDIRWHRRAYLPMISDEKNREDDRAVARAMWLALIYGGLPEEHIRGEKVLFASFKCTTGRRIARTEAYDDRDIVYDGKAVRINDVYALYKALQSDDITVMQFTEVYQKAFEDDTETGLENMEFVGPRARWFAKRLISAENPDRNALNMIARFALHSESTQKETDIIFDALEQIFDELNLTEERLRELRALIFKASRFASPNASRSGLERSIDFDYWQGK